MLRDIAFFSQKYLYFVAERGTSIIRHSSKKEASRSGRTLKDSKKGSAKNSCFLFILSYTVASRKNVRHIFFFLGEPKTLNLAHN